MRSRTFSGLGNVGSLTYWLDRAASKASIEDLPRDVYMFGGKSDRGSAGIGGFLETTSVVTC